MSAGQLSHKMVHDRAALMIHLEGVGAGGQQKPYLVNAANALTYGSVNALKQKGSKRMDQGQILISDRCEI